MQGNHGKLEHRHKKQTVSRIRCAVKTSRMGRKYLHANLLFSSTLQMQGANLSSRVSWNLLKFTFIRKRQKSNDAKWSLLGVEDAFWQFVWEIMLTRRSFGSFWRIEAVRRRRERNLWSRRTLVKRENEGIKEVSNMKDNIISDTQRRWKLEKRKKYRIMKREK